MLNDIYMIESKEYDCSRGCTVERHESGEVECNYRQGCCKLEVYDWLSGVSQEQYKEYFEVRFKNTRKGIFRNASGQSIKTGDLVIVEASNGHDLGIVTCLLYTSPSPRDLSTSRMPSSA